MSIDNNKSFTAGEAHAKAASVLERFFDGGVFTEINAVYSDSSPAQAVCGYGYVDSMVVCAFCQDFSESSGAVMSVAQSNKLTKLYELALKIGAPVVGFYTSSGAKLSQGNVLLDSVSKLLGLSSRLSGVVPQISVILKSCVGTCAILAANADFVIKTDGADLALEPLSKPCSLGVINKKDEESAIASARELITYLPSNNLSSASVAFEYEVNEASGFMSAFDANTLLPVYGENGSDYVYFARLDGNAVGVVQIKDDLLGKHTVKNIAKFVRFCDAFSIPVISDIDAEGFKCLEAAKKILSAYSEATTPKIAVVSGKAVGAVYICAVSTADFAFALEDAVVSPIKPIAAAYIFTYDDNTSLTVNQQNEQIKDYISSELSALKAAELGYISDVISPLALRERLSSALDMLLSKREATMPKKHSTI